MLRILSAFVLKAAGPVPAGFSVFLWPTFAVYRPSRPRDFLSDLPGALVPVVESAVPYLESRYLRYLSRRERLHDPSDPPRPHLVATGDGRSRLRRLRVRDDVAPHAGRITYH